MSLIGCTNCYCIRQFWLCSHLKSVVQCLQYSFFVTVKQLPWTNPPQIHFRLESYVPTYPLSKTINLNIHLYSRSELPWLEPDIYNRDDHTQQQLLAIEDIPSHMKHK